MPNYQNDAQAIERYGFFEGPARALCAHDGVDPDEWVQHGYAEFAKESGFFPSGFKHTQRWVFAAREIYNHQKRRARAQLIDGLVFSFTEDGEEEGG